MKMTRATITASVVIGFGLQLIPFFGQAATHEAAATYDAHVARTVTVGTTRYRVDYVRVDLANPRLEVRSVAATTKSSCYQQSCVVKPLRSYLSSTSGIAAINGTYFCPADYTTCGAAGNFYWTVYNDRNNIVINQSQNRFNRGALFTIDTKKQWHFYRDTQTFPGVAALRAVDGAELTGAISNGPALIDQGRYIVKTSELDTKQRTVKSNRSGLGIKGNVLYLVVARGATVQDLGKIMQALKMDYAMNLDGGGSSALWYRGSYKVGPGRNIPNALVVRTK